MPIFDRHKSKIKLWVGIKGSKTGDVYYSILSHDHKPEKFIIDKMTRRILENKYKGIFTAAHFYDNHTDRLISTIEGLTDTGNKELSKIKLWIGFPDDVDNETWYSLISENALDFDKIIKVMTNRILIYRHKYQFTKALFFNNQTGILLKTIEGNLVKK